MRAIMIAALLAVLAGSMAHTCEIGTAGVVNTPIATDFILYSEVSHVDQTSTLVLENGPANGLAIIQFAIFTVEAGTPVTRYSHHLQALDAVGGARVVVPLADIVTSNDMTVEVRAFYLDPNAPTFPFMQAATLWTVDVIRLADASDLAALDPDAYAALEREIEVHRSHGAAAALTHGGVGISSMMTSHAFAPDNPSSPTCPDLAGPGVWFSATAFSSGPAGVFTVN